MNTNTTTNRPSLTFYHANAKGTGCAARFTLHPAIAGEDGFIELMMTPQLTVGDRLATPPIYPTFDWENTATIRLTFDDLCQMLQVFRGETESINNGRGLYHRTTSSVLVLGLRHVVEPVCGYSLELYRDNRAVSFFLTPGEALGISCAIEASMGKIAFGM